MQAKLGLNLQFPSFFQPFESSHLKEIVCLCLFCLFCLVTIYYSQNNPLNIYMIITFCHANFDLSASVSFVSWKHYIYCQVLFCYPFLKISQKIYFLFYVYACLFMCIQYVHVWCPLTLPRHPSYQSYGLLLSLLLLHTHTWMESEMHKYVTTTCQLVFVVCDHFKWVPSWKGSFLG